MESLATATQIRPIQLLLTRDCLKEFLVFPLAGPSVLAMSGSQERLSCGQRLRGDLARKVAKTTANVIYCMHNAGWVHGDLSTWNILFHVSEAVRRWSDAEVYTFLGPPVTEEVRTRGGELRGPHVPRELVAPIKKAKFVEPWLLQESVVVIDYGQSYPIACPPWDSQYSTVLNYLSPEAQFEGSLGPEADVWALGCAIFEIRVGFPLFGTGSDTKILKQTIETLGRLPDPWWSLFEERALWFEEDGEPRSVEAQKRDGLGLISFSKSPIRMKLRSICTQDDPSYFNEGKMVEKPGVRLDEGEVELLGDLLGKMLRYRAEDRIGIRDVVEHPWFSYA